MSRQVKVQAEEAAKMAFDSKMVVETESLKSMEQALEDKSTEISKVSEPNGTHLSH